VVLPIGERSLTQALARKHNRRNAVIYAIHLLTANHSLFSDLSHIHLASVWRWPHPENRGGPSCSGAIVVLFVFDFCAVSNAWVQAGREIGIAPKCKCINSLWGWFVWVRHGSVCRRNVPKSDLKSADLNRSWGFKSPSGHQIK